MCYCLFMIIADDHNIYKEMNIVMYGSFIHSVHRKNDIQRHKVFSRLAMRVVLSPQFWNKKDYLLHSINLRGYGLDNGAYIDYNKGTEFDEDRFINMCKDLGNGADWIAIPDVVGNSKATLEQANEWIDRLELLDLDTKLLLVWQDGMTKDDLLPFVSRGYGIFVGGTTDPKLAAIPWISSLCIEYNVWCHVGRVNTMRRLKYCLAHKVKSIDGSGYTQFLTHNKKFINYFAMKKKQTTLFSEEKLTFTILKTLKQRLSVFCICSSTYDEMLLIDTDYIGLGKNDSKQDYPFLRWDR